MPTASPFTPRSRQVHRNGDALSPAALYGRAMDDATPVTDSDKPAPGAAKVEETRPDTSKGGIGGTTAGGCTIAKTVSGVGQTNTLVLTPFINGGSAGKNMLGANLLLGAAGIQGTLDWACASTSQAAATNVNVGLVGGTLGSLNARYAPAACR